MISDMRAVARDEKMTVELPFLYDISRMVVRAAIDTPSGIDRVEHAWLAHLLDTQKDVAFLLTLKRKTAIMPRSAGEMLRRWFAERDPKLLPLYSRLACKLGRDRRGLRHAFRRQAETEFFDIAQDAPAFQAALRARFPQGGWYINHGQLFMTPPLMRALRAGGMQRMMMLHDTIPLDFPEFCISSSLGTTTELVELLATECELAVCNSRATETDLLRHAQRITGALPKCQIVSAHLGMSEQQGETTTAGAVPPQIDPARPFFLILGTIEPRKNHAFLLDLWEDLAKRLPPQAMPQLVIAGRWGWMITEFRARLEAHPLYGKSVFVVEGPDDATVAALMQNARALLMPSFAEGYGLPVIEALVAGVRVIAPPFEVYREIAGDAPIYCPLGDVEAWGRAVTALSGPERLPPLSNAVSPPRWPDHFATVFAAID